MALKPRYTKQLPVQMTPEHHDQLEWMYEHDPAAHSLAGAARILMDLGTVEYRRTHPESAPEAAE